MKNLFKLASAENPARFVCQVETYKIPRDESLSESNISKASNNILSLLDKAEFNMSEKFPQISIPKEIENGWMIAKIGDEFECYNSKVGILFKTYNRKFDIATFVTEPRGINIFRKKEQVVVHGSMNYSEKEKLDIFKNLLLSLKKEKTLKETKRLISKHKKRLSNEERRKFFPSKVDRDYNDNHEGLRENIKKALNLLAEGENVPKSVLKNSNKAAEKMIRHIINENSLDGELQIQLIKRFLEYLKDPSKYKIDLKSHYKAYFDGDDFMVIEKNK